MKLTGESYIIIFLLITCVSLAFALLGISKELKKTHLLLCQTKEELDDQYRTINWRIDGLITTLQDLITSFDDVLKKPLETKRGRPKKEKNNG